MRVIQHENGKLIFTDYLQRKISIAEKDYLELMAVSQRREIRPALEDCLSDPTEVWWNMETIDGTEYSYYKYFKFYSDLVFVAYVLLDENLKMSLNNFYAFAEDKLDEADKERCGQLIHSASK